MERVEEEEEEEEEEGLGDCCAVVPGNWGIVQTIIFIRKHYHALTCMCLCVSAWGPFTCACFFTGISAALCVLVLVPLHNLLCSVCVCVCMLACGRPRLPSVRARRCLSADCHAQAEPGQLGISVLWFRFGRRSLGCGLLWGGECWE